MIKIKKILNLNNSIEITIKTYIEKSYYNNLKLFLYLLNKKEKIRSKILINLNNKDYFLCRLEEKFDCISIEYKIDSKFVIGKISKLHFFNDHIYKSLDIYGNFGIIYLKCFNGSIREIEENYLKKYYVENQTNAI